MCRAVLESSENEGMAEGINNGIVYLAFLTLSIGFFMIFFVYKNLKNRLLIFYNFPNISLFPFNN